MKNELMFERKVCFTNDLPPEEVVKILVEEKVDHLIQGEDCEAHRQRIEFFERDRQTFFDHPLKPWVTGSDTDRFGEMALKTMADKSRSLELIERILRGTYGQNLTDSGLKVLEELLMNAIHDAPQIAIQNGRETEVFASRPAVRLRYLFSKNAITFACEDFYGELIPREVFGRIHSIYKAGVRESIRMDSKTGAGLGCFIMLQECQEMVFAVQPQIKSMVVASLTVEPSLKKRTRFLKNVHLVY